MQYQSIYQTPVAQAWGEVLNRGWQIFGGLTFKGGRSIIAAAKILLAMLEKCCPDSIYAAAIGPNHKGGDVHIHLLIGKISSIEKMTLQYEWNRHYGQAFFAPYDPEQGGRVYMGSKFVDIPFFDYNPDTEFVTNLSSEADNA
jgi:hypothetical protein